MLNKIKEKITALKNRTPEEKGLSRQKIKLAIILSVEFIAIALVLVLIFFSGKKSYTVTFDLDGGILISGDLDQRVMQGSNATPPTAAKFGHYLRGWEGSYKSITQDVTIKAIWEYETTAGIEYSLPSNTNYCEISGSFEQIQGEIFIGAYHSSGRKVLGIKDGAFKQRTGITSVHLLDGILSIGTEAFLGCEKMEHIDLPSTVVKIGKDAFKNCTSLTSITLPENIEVIESGAFAGCTSLTTVIIPEGIKTISSSAFEGCTSLTEIVIPEGIETIEASAFAGCTSLKEAVLPSTLKTISQNLFMNCASLENVTITEGINIILSSAFSGCTSLGEIFIPQSVRKINNGAFDTPEMTINLYVYQEDLPKHFAKGWCPEDAIINFGVNHNEDDPPYEGDDSEYDIKIPGLEISPDILDRFPNKGELPGIQIPSIEDKGDLDLGDILDRELGGSLDLDSILGENKTDETTPEEEKSDEVDDL